MRRALGREARRKALSRVLVGDACTRDNHLHPLRFSDGWATSFPCIAVLLRPRRSLSGLSGIIPGIKSISLSASIVVNGASGSGLVIAVVFAL